MKKMVVIYMVVMVVTGSLNTIITKIIESEPFKFYHGFFTSWLMFIGEMIPLFILNIPLVFNKQKKQNYFIEQIKNQNNNDKKPIYKNWVVGFGSFFDCIGSTCVTLALVFLPPSLSQIGRGGIIFTVALYSRIFLKKRLNIKQISGIAVVILGILVVFLGQHFVDKQYNADHPNKNKDNSKNVKSSTGKLIIGSILLLISWFIQGFQMVYQEKLLGKYEIDLFRYVGLEGSYGLLFSAFILIFTGLIPCKYSFCPIGNLYETKVDSPSTGIMRTFGSVGIFFLNFGYIISITIFNISGLTLTSNVSALFRMILDNVRSIVVWIVFLIAYPDIEYFCSSQLIKWLGFALFVFGTLLYNQIIFSKKEKVKIESSKKSDILSSLRK